MMENIGKFRLKLLRVYVGSALIATTTSVISWILIPHTGITSLFLLYILGVTIAGSFAGLRAGLLTTIFIVLFVDFYAFPPFHKLNNDSYMLVFQCVQFIFFAILISLILDRLKDAKIVVNYKRKEHEYLKQIDTLQKENENYKREIKARDEFLSVASHELKTPLTSMLLQLQTVLYNIRNVSLANFSVENLMKMLQSAEQQTVRLSKMINDLLNVSLITTGRLELELEKVNLTKLTQEMIDHLTAKDGRDKPQIRLSVKKTVIGVWDKLRIEQAIINLITNAIKYGENKPIDIQIDTKGSYAILKITDHGIGISSDLQTKVFSKFERAVSNHDYQGLGVGLYITSQIVKAHGGKIQLKSKLHQGSTFILELPIQTTTK